jgi:hypothetical protein
MSDTDSTWKEALQRYLQPFLALFFPKIHDDIDWTRGYEWLDKELHKLTRKDEVGGRIVDVLVKVYRKNGKERWLLIHIEVQGSYEAVFPQRMFVYHYRIFNRFKRKVCSLAILADDRPNWRPKRYSHALWGCRVTFTFPNVKLLDLMPRLAELEASTNPFAIMVASHLLAQQTRDDPVQRRIRRMGLYRQLAESGLSHEDIAELFHLLDGTMVLPETEDALFWDEIEQWEKEKSMPHMTRIERRGREQGRAEGRAEGQAELLLFAAEKHFKRPLPAELAARIRQSTDTKQFQSWLELLYSCGCLEEFQQRMGG